MRSLMNFQILRSSKDLPAAREGTGERLLPGVDTQVVHQLVLGLEGPPGPRTRVPTARVVRYLGSAHVLHRQMSHNLVHGAEYLVAGLAGRGLLRLNPEAGYLLLDRLPHVPVYSNQESDKN